MGFRSIARTGASKPITLDPSNWPSKKTPWINQLSWNDSNWNRRSIMPDKNIIILSITHIDRVQTVNEDSNWLFSNQTILNKCCRIYSIQNIIRPFLFSKYHQRTDKLETRKQLTYQILSNVSIINSFHFLNSNQSNVNVQI